MAKSRCVTEVSTSETSYKVGSGTILLCVSILSDSLILLTLVLHEICTGKRSGYGKLTMNNEVIFEGQWEDDAPLYDQSLLPIADHSAQNGI